MLVAELLRSARVRSRSARARCGNAMRPALARPGQGQLRADGRSARVPAARVRADSRNSSPRRLNRAARGDAQGFGEQFGRVERGERLDAAQMPLAIRKQGDARLRRSCSRDGSRSAHPAGRAAGAHACARRRLATSGSPWRLPSARRRASDGGIVGAVMQFDRDPGATAEVRNDPCGGRIVEILLLFCKPAHVIRRYPRFHARHSGAGRDPVTFRRMTRSSAMRLAIKAGTLGPGLRGDEGEAG